MKRRPANRQRTQARAADEQSPLQYMLEVMRDPSASKSRRDRMAVTAARYLHPRPGDKGKKNREADAARKAGAETEWGSDLASDWQQH
jgi:hypothetical protein